MAKKEKEHTLFERVKDWAENAMETAEKNASEDKLNNWSPTGGTGGKKTTAETSTAATKTSTSVSPGTTGRTSTMAITAGVPGSASASAGKPTAVNSALASALSGKNENNSPYASESASVTGKSNTASPYAANSLWERLEAIVPGSSAPENRPQGNDQNIRDGIYRYFLPNLGSFGGGPLQGGNGPCGQ